MILQRLFEALLSGLRWLFYSLFPQAVLLTILLCVGVGTAVVVVAWSYRRRSGTLPGQPPLAGTIRSPRRQKT